MAEEIRADIENIDAVKRRLKVTVPAADVDREFDRAWRELRRTAVLPGFRKGHVPLQRLRQLYGEDVKGDVAREVILAAYDKAVKQTGARPVGGPDIKEYDLAEGRDLTFTAELEVRPEIELAPYDGMKLTRELAPVTDEDVLKVLDELRLRVAPVQAAEEGRGVRTGDVAMIDFAGTSGGNPVPGGSGTGFPLEVGSATFVPGFEDALIGMKKGETREFDLTLPSDYHNTGLAGKEAHFTVTLADLKERVPQPLDDDFAKDVGSYASLEELKGKVRENIASTREHEARGRLKQAALEALRGGPEFPLPAGLVAAEEETIVRDFARRMAMRGLPPEQARTNLESSRDEVGRAASMNVRTSLLLDEVARREGIKLDKEDLDRALADMAAQTHKPAAELRKEMIKAGTLEDFAQVILEDKTLDWLVGRAEVTTVEPPPRAGGK